MGLPLPGTSRVSMTAGTPRGDRFFGDGDHGDHGRNLGFCPSLSKGFMWLFGGLEHGFYFSIHILGIS